MAGASTRPALVAACAVLASLAGVAAGGAAPVADELTYSASRKNVSHLWQLDLGTGARRQLTRGRHGEDAAAWSRDGRRLVFTAMRSVRPPRARDRQVMALIAVMDVRTRAVRTITDGRRADEDPTWSPDGLRISFARTRIPSGTETTYPEIWVMRRSGRGLLQLTHNSVSDIAPAWSPDGGSIAFTRLRRSSQARDLWVMRSSGRGQRRLVRNGSRPAWSPDGRHIAYGRLVGRTRGCCPATDLIVVDAAGRNPRLVARNGGRPVWSPDGTRLAFQRSEGERTHLWVVRADGTGLRRLTRGRGSEYAPSWRPR